MLGSQEPLYWQKALRILSGQSLRHSLSRLDQLPHLRMCNALLERMCRPTEAPDELGVEWSLSIVNDVCRMARVSELQ